MDHTPYSPNLVSGGLHLFGPLKRHLYDKWFATSAYVQQTVTSCLRALDIYFVYSGMETLVTGWDKFLHVSGNYMESWRVPSAVNVPCRPAHRSQISFRHQSLCCNIFFKLLCVYYSLFYSLFVSSSGAELRSGQSHRKCRQALELLGWNASPFKGHYLPQDNKQTNTHKTIVCVARGVRV